MREYEILAGVNVTPESSMTEVKNASFKLMANRMTPEQRQAWDALRNPETRLAIDFLRVALCDPDREAR
jgi:hypothetical protein